MANTSPRKSTPFTLIASSPLNGHSVCVDGASLAEITNVSIVSVAPFTNGKKGLEIAIFKLLGGSPLNAVNTYESPVGRNILFLPSAHGQWFLCFDNDGADPVDAASGLLGRRLSSQLTMTDQSDAWVIIALAGSLVRCTLERICPINCSAAAMPVGTAARTMIEHLGAIIVRRSNDCDGNPNFWLLSARSSASNFLHAIKASPPFTT